MSSANKIIPHYTYDDWLHWEGRWELIDGHPIAMSPAPIPRHQKVSGRLITELTLALRQAKCKHCEVYNFIDYKIDEHTILEPDILIVCGEIKKKYLDFPPALVVEILSPSTALKDRHTKYEFYEQQGVKYYLIVDADKNKIEVYELRGKVYEQVTQTNSYSFTLADDCSIMPDLSNVFN